MMAVLLVIQEIYLIEVFNCQFTGLILGIEQVPELRRSQGID